MNLRSSFSRLGRSAISRNSIRPTGLRGFSSNEESTEVFDRELKRLHRQHAYNRPDAEDYDYLRAEAADRLLDRLDDITRTFPVALDIGSYRNHILDGVRSRENFRTNEGGGLSGIKDLVTCDIIDSHRHRSSSLLVDSNSSSEVVKAHSIVADEEFLPFKEKSFDLVLSNLSLHWTNDILGALRQIKTVLKPDGVFVGNMFCGNTLKELRHSFYLAENERKGGFAPHGSPLAKTSDVAYLMQTAGFSMPTVDVDTVTVSYPDAFTLMEHLQKMGEGSAALNREYAVGTDTFLAMASIYQQLYGLEDGSIPATFEIVHMIGWGPAESQPKACSRGSAKRSLKELETPSG